MPHTIVAVDDGSSDSTKKILKALAKKNRLIVTGYKLNMNIGAAFGTGIDWVLEHGNDRDSMVIMEADGTSKTSLIPKLLESLGSAEIVIASRYLPGGGYRHFPGSRMLFSLAANRLLRWYFPINKIRDYTIFFRAYRISIVKRGVDWFGRFGLIQSKGFVANAELLIKLSLFTKRITEIPFVYDYSGRAGQSKIHLLATVNEYFTAVTYLRNVMKRLYMRINEPCK